LLLNVLLVVHIVALLLVVTGMTPLTHNLDDIKILLFFIGGPILMLLATAGIAARILPTPPRVIGASLLAYLLIAFLSTLTAQFRWESWHQMALLWSAGGMFLSAMAIGSHPRLSETFLRYLVAQLLLACLIGFFFFDVTNSPNHLSGVSILHRLLYDSLRPPYDNASPFRSLLWTLVNADKNMQSTILSRDFFAAFCVLYLPFALLLSLDPGPRNRLLWRGVGCLAALLTILAIFYCRSKGEWIFGILTIVIFSAIFSRIGQMPGLRKRYLLATVGGLLLLLLSIAWMLSPDLLSQLKGLDYSVKSRSIIWAGAVGIFLDHPILGAGPGNFRVFFPEHRAHDYFLHEISNVTLYAHNYFLDLLAETGILGFAAFVCFLLCLLGLALRWAFKHPDPRLRGLLTAMVAGIFGIFGSNLSSPNGRWVIGASSLWTVLGFCCGAILQARGIHAGRLEPAEGPDPTQAPRRPRLTLAAALVAVALVALPLCAYRGYVYFDSAIDYARGMRMMEPAYDMLTSGRVSDPEMVAAMLQRSATDFEQSIKDNPSNVSSYYKLGSIYSTLSSLTRDEASRRNAAGQPDEARRLTEVADYYLVASKRNYAMLQQRWPDYAEIHYNLGIIYYDYAQLLDRIARGETPPRVLDSVDEGKDYRAEAERYRQLALEHVQRMSELSIKPEVYRQRGQLLATMQLSERALQVYAEGAERYPEDRQLLGQYLMTAEAAGDPVAMADVLEHLWRLNPSDELLLQQLLDVALQHELNDVLERTLEEMERINPIDPQLYAARAQLFRNRNEPELLMRAVERYLRVGGRDPETIQLGIETAQALNNSEILDRLTQLREQMTSQP